VAEKLYTIPVNDAFDEHSECPICSMYQKLEDDAISFMMGPSYMEDDIRMETDRIGFCKPHMLMLSKQENRLGLALILKTHLDRQKKEALQLMEKPVSAKKLFKKPEEPEIVRWAREKTRSCYICDRINIMFPHYLDTVLRLYQKDSAFREKYAACNGFCQEHFGLLIGKAQEVLKEQDLQSFVTLTAKLYTDNIQRLSDDLDWFTDKFDYRYRDAPWKNSRDAIERAVTKTNGILQKEKGKEK